MEPQLPMPHQSPEMGPRPIGPEAPRPQTAETYTGAEKQEVHEQKAAHSDGDGPVQAAPVTPVAPPSVPANPVQQVQPASDTPAVASDEDLIEKEWVEKAKKVIAETKHDPYMQKQAVSRLQADYLNKRYGKSVKLPEEG
jgi:hypothetical protein